MSDQYFFKYGGYELHCKPREEAHGRFSAHLRIVHASGTRPEEKRIDLSAVPSFDSAGEAADHARVIGQEWVDKHGGPYN
jgi:hypothetical protein